MKNRITILAENDAPLDPKYKDCFEVAAKVLWQELLDTLTIDSMEKATVEKVEVFD